MTKLCPFGLLLVIPTREQKTDRVGKLRLSKTARMVLLFCMGSAIAAPAQTFTTLVEFDNTNGASPQVGLIQGLDGNIYGATTGSRPSVNSTLFKITPAGELTTLYTFCAQTNGGTGANGGTVFRITPAGTLTTLYSFCIQATCPDGGALARCFKPPMETSTEQPGAEDPVWAPCSRSPLRAS
jgi:uncharacterized repeat protein (TIGR03803 family)